MDIGTALARLRGHLRASDAMALQGRDGAEVRRAFAELGAVATEDVVAMYGVSGGPFEDGLWVFWSLDELAARNRDGDFGGVAFADFLIDSEVYTLHPRDAATSEVREGTSGEDRLVAASLAEFIMRCLDDPDSMP
jgi:hypothetical protein